ncbi:MAG: hypothetical protein ACMXYL_05150 [Candidatus Woesearchaeota archaeon]
MNINDVYGIGALVPIDSVRIKSWDEKLRFVEFPYTSKEVIFTALIVFLTFITFNIIVSPFSEFMSYVSLFLALGISIILLFYPFNIYYYSVIGKYNEEMLYAIMRLSTYISMNTSIEYAFISVTPEIKGVLKRQFTRICEKIERKEETSLGDAMKEYIPVWNAHNPIFVKSLRLLQTASYAAEADREKILLEVSDTLIWNYTVIGKRYAEELSEKAKKLIMLGVLFPIMMLMLLPMITIFMPELVNPSMLAFVYIVLFPMITLIMSLNLASKRIQVSTIHIEESVDYTPMNPLIPVVLGIMAFIVFLIGLYSVSIIDVDSDNFSGDIFTIIPGWIAPAGLAIAIIIYSTLYTRRYNALWTKIYSIEQDLPHVLQSFTTYQKLNLPMERIIPEVIDDYKNFGFGNHPVVNAFESIDNSLKTSKKSFVELTKGNLKTLIPSTKVSNILEQMVSFSEISQESSAKVAEMIRKHTLSIHKLDDYMKTLLSETISLVNITTTMLAPLLSAAAVLMSVAIVRSIFFIEEQMLRIGQAFGVGDLNLQLIEVSNIIPPQLMQFIIGIYLVLTIGVLTFFAKVINIGNDRYTLMKDLRSNMIGFLIYTIILFGGFILIDIFFTATFG